ncbi:phosphotransferase family protein [Paenibacillus sp. J2TS4]|uniref:phosphotransferase family protein n=1 Tax=Paenibacillus sp. J2TS4 TaxID=2807194 RepID=UPI0020BDC47E|nr:aminoglycoside phosphotransferase family protein [Paenibacillus sp. J2TS4]
MMNAEEPIRRIWHEYNLAPVQSIVSLLPDYRRYIVNDRYVIHFSSLQDESVDLHSEKEAYRILRGASVPVPETIVLDESGRVVPFSFLITTRLKGGPLSRSWPDLEAPDREHLAREAGRYLATIHTYSFDTFKTLSAAPGDEGFTNGYRYIQNKFRKYARKAINADRIEKTTIARIKMVLDKLRPLFERVEKASLLHGQFHLNQLWQHNGELTGIIGFEQAHTGDPAFDLQSDDRLDPSFPGYLPSFYEGYEQVKALEPQNVLKQSFCKLLFYLDRLAVSSPEPREAYEENHNKLSRQLNLLEINTVHLA